ncbi:non-specific lipid-transfer protein A-like [Populus alba x Populus x berolinensis]|uniref:Non-specific lipid-transfer protein A-like n=1 Tax=Populus alba x Populus x berolinensis TaxID=444605 RepID=A0AAD6M4J5_9ROSI|nr:non-specific lipid-transfer protein A-like [Populus alba x Populus x berolinensis]
MKKKIVVAVIAFWLTLSFGGGSTSVADDICTEAMTKLLNCLPFLTTTAPSPSLSCCVAVGWVSQHATTTQDRRVLCKCLKSASLAYKVDPTRAKELPDVCKVPVPVPILPQIDCDKIQSSID